jgi:D-3-phosphoglycerate dehydrogenase
MRRTDPLASFKVVMVVKDMPSTPEWVPRQLEEHGIEFVENECASPSEVIGAAGDADVVWVLGGAPVVTAAVLPELKRCRAILRTGTGTENVPVAAATERGIVVGNTPEATTHQVAEHAIALFLAVIRQIAAQDRLVRQGVWDRYRAWPDWHIAGQTFGLLGFGRIAQLVARKLSGFEMSLIASDPGIDEETMARHGVAKVDADDVLARADFVSIHVPLSARTHHLIGERELRLMKPKAVLINTARGALIDEAALVRALDERWIAAAGLDVFETEPLPGDHPLLRLDNVVVTPHIASYSDVFHERFWRQSVDTVIELARGRRPLWVVNPEVRCWWESDASPGLERARVG